jgi:D-alanyl-D-alanine-carboxypeptidase/D-alanyl-D-alanine-endopeptidase
MDCILLKSKGSIAYNPCFPSLHLLDAQRPLFQIQAAKERKEVAVDPKLFDGYVGRYQLARGLILTVTREGTHLFAQATGQGKAARPS